MIRRLALTIFAALLLAGCAGSRESERARLVVPGDVGAVYSDVELQASLLLKSDSVCAPSACGDIESFRARARALGERLSAAAALLAQELELKVPRLVVGTPGKEDIGLLSSASGQVMVFDGIRQLELTDPALAFLIAREMGHVLGQHHEENTATGLAVSVAVALLFPVTGILQGLEAAYATSTLATTATSFAGSRVVRTLYREPQRREADLFALLILARAGWTPRDVAAALQSAEPYLAGGDWLAELRDSKHWLDALASGPEPEPTPPRDISPGEFGPAFDSDTLWIAGLLYGQAGIERLCPAHLPVASVAPPAAAKPQPVKQVKKPSKAGKKKKRVKPVKKPRIQKAAVSRPSSTRTLSPTRQ